MVVTQSGWHGYDTKWLAWLRHNVVGMVMTLSGWHGCDTQWLAWL